MTGPGGTPEFPGDPCDVTAPPPPATGPVPPAPSTAVTRPCRCGHGRDAHQHYRPGSDCALCGCRRYTRRLPFSRRRS